MAESDTTATPAAEDGRARVNTDGTVSTEGGRDAFVWCQDDGTGHRFDLPARALPVKGVTVIEGYPLNYDRIGRTAKTATDLAGDPAEPKGTRVTVDETPADTDGSGDAGTTTTAKPAAKVAAGKDTSAKGPTA